MLDADISDLVSNIEHQTFTIETPMPKFGVRVPHTLDQGRSPHALGAVHRNADGKVRQPSERYDSNRGRATRSIFISKRMASRIDGGITIADNELNLAGEIPFAAMMFKGKIESEIREQLERIVAA